MGPRDCLLHCLVPLHLHQRALEVVVALRVAVVEDGGGGVGLARAVVHVLAVVEERRVDVGELLAADLQSRGRRGERCGIRCGA